MRRLPLLEKNAYLTVQILDGEIHAVLAYAHYDIGRSYKIHDRSRFDPDVDPIGERFFWHDYLSNLQKALNWELIAESSTEHPLDHVVDFKDEGAGVANIEFVLEGAHKYRVRIISALRDLLPTAQVRSVDEGAKARLYHDIREKLQYTDMLYLDLSLKKFDAYRITRGTTYDSYQTHHAKIHWDSENSLIDTIYDARLQAFASEDFALNGAENLWANFVLEPTYRVQSPMLKDVIRSFLSVQLISLFNNNAKVFEDFGSSGQKTLLLLSGNLLETISQRSLLIALIDGLQLRGHFEVMYDIDYSWSSFGKIYIEGINSRDFIVSRDHISGPQTLVLTADVPGNPNAPQVVFNGEIINSKSGQDNIYVLSNSVESFKLSQKGIRNVITGKFVKGAYVEGLGEDVEFAYETAGTMMESVLIDARFKPVVYGPTYSSNQDKLSVWLSE